MADKLVNYSLYDVKGDRYDVKITQREVDVFERYPRKMYAKINELKRQGHEPAKRAGPSRKKGNATSSASGQGNRKRAVTSSPFIPKFNSITVAESQESLINSPIVSPLAKKICEKSTSKNSDNTSRRQLSFCTESSSHVPDNLNKSFEYLSVGNELSVNNDKISYHDTVTGESANKSSASSDVAGINEKDLPDKESLLGSPYVLVDFNFTDENKGTVNDVKGFLLNKMYEAGFLSQGEDCIVSTSIQGSSAVIVKFRTCEEANLACLLEDVYFCGSKLNLSKHATGSENNVLSITGITSTENSETQASTSDLNIYDGEGYFIYAQLLIKYRKDFPKNGAHDPVLNIILSKLQKKGVKCTLADLRIKRDRMKKLFNKKKKYEMTEHEFYAPGRVMFEGGDISLIRGTHYDPEHLGSESCDEENNDELSTDEDNDDLLKFSKVAVWTHNASMALLDNLLVEPDDFYKAGRRTHFWRRIERQMVQQKFFYSAEQCERRLEVLRSSYRNFHDENLRSGAAGPAFTNADQNTIQLLEKVGAFVNYRGPLGSQAKVSFSIGVRQQERHADNSSSCGGRVGKVRPNILSRRPSTKLQLEERRIAAMELKARALDRLSRRTGNFDNTSDEDDY